MFGVQITYRVHAVQRMFERGIAEAEVLDVIRNDDAIEWYPQDSPYPSRLLLGIVNGLPLHVVAAYNAAEDQTIVITAYRPDSSTWSADFRIRGKK